MADAVIKISIIASAIFAKQLFIKLKFTYV